MGTIIAAGMLALSLLAGDPAPECELHVYTHSDGFMQVEQWGRACRYEEYAATSSDQLVHIIKDVSSEFTTTVTFEEE